MTATKKTTTAQAVDKAYRLLKYQPLTFELKTGRDNNLLMFDEKSKRQRAIRHCPNEQSIFVDEQSDVAVVAPIVFSRGILYTKATQPTTQLFLDSHPKNGTVFEEVNDAADAQELTDYEEIKLDVKQAIRAKSKEEGGIEELRVVVGVLNSNVGQAAKMTGPELKNSLYDLVETKLNRFIDEDDNVTIFDDPEIKRIAIAQQAFNSGVIQVSPDATKIVWSDSKALICNIPTGLNHLDYFSEYLASPEGMAVALEVSKRS